MLDSLMDERMRRQWAGAEAAAYGWGGVGAVAQATGLSPTTIRKGVAEVRARTRRPGRSLPTRLRRVGGGRKCKTESDPELSTALESPVESTARGDPQSPRRWTCKSTRRLAEELRRRRFRASPGKVAALLKEAGYSLQSNRKTREGLSHPDRDA